MDLNGWWNRIRILSAVLGAGSVIFLLVTGYGEWDTAIPALLLAAALAVWLWSGRSLRRERERRRADNERLLLIRAVNHLRHDWMNDLQVLFGYIQLNKQDKLKAYIDKLSDKLYRESLMSKLGDSELIAYLISFRARKSNMELHVRPEKDVNFSALGKNGKLAAGSLITVIEAYDAAAEPNGGDPNQLLVAIDLLGDETAGFELMIDFEYTGNYRSDSLLESITGIMELFRKNEDYSASYDMQEGAADIELRLQVTELTG